ISNTIVKPLHQLRLVTQAIGSGQLDSRVMVSGRDEIADVSASVNGMLDTIVGLLQETRGQRDALTNAANHLFSYMQGVSSGELRATATLSNDPISLLAEAFNFTISRFRRFVLRTQVGIEQLEVVSRQEVARSDAFVQTVHTYH